MPKQVFKIPALATICWDMLVPAESAQEALSLAEGVTSFDQDSFLESRCFFDLGEISIAVLGDITGDVTFSPVTLATAEEAINAGITDEELELDSETEAREDEESQEALLDDRAKTDEPGPEFYPPRK